MTSVCEITKPDTYDGSEPVINGLFDPRMGVIDRGPKCATCENKSEMCPGHFGHIELALPVYHMHFVHIVMKLLPCVCFRCSTLLVRKNNKKLVKNLQGKKGENRFQVIYEASTKSQKSPRCCHNHRDARSCSPCGMAKRRACWGRSTGRCTRRCQSNRSSS